MNDLSYDRVFEGGVEEAIERLGAEMRSRGFGVLATLRVHEILREKLGRTIEPLVILEVCSPAHAERALATSRRTALLLPCKIVVSREEGATRIALQRPTRALGALLPLPALEELGAEVEWKLREAVDAACGAAPPPPPAGARP